MSITQDCITHYNSINSNINSNINSDNNSNNNNPNQQSIPPVAMEISRYDRWLYLHYLPSVLVPHVNTIYENNNGNTNGNTNKNSKNTNKNSNENTNENSENSENNHNHNQLRKEMMANMKSIYNWHTSAVKMVHTLH